MGRGDRAECGREGMRGSGAKRGWAVTGSLGATEQVSGGPQDQWQIRAGLQQGQVWD